MTFGKKLALLAVAIALAVVVSVAGLHLFWTAPGPGPGREGDHEWELRTGQETFAGTGQENGSTVHEVSLEWMNIAEVCCTLTWLDEPASRPQFTNQPDELGINVTSPSGEAKSDSDVNPIDGEGRVELVFVFSVTNESAARHPSKEGKGKWVVTVNIGTCGDQTTMIYDPLRTVQDTGNAYTLTVLCKYYAKVVASPK